MIKNGLYELDSVISNKENDDDTRDVYFVDIEKEEHGNLVAEFKIENNGIVKEIDKYKITIEMI